MAVVDLSDVASTLGPLIGTAIVAGVLTLKERKKDRSNEAPEGGQTTSVVAAYFFDREIVHTLSASLAAVEAQLSELNGHMERAAQDRHDRKIAQEAAESVALKALLERKS